MCGIAGFIGQSKQRKVTAELMTALFDFLEIRGKDASGLWATEPGIDGRVFYHKEPIRSSKFVEKTYWKKLVKVKLNLLLVHARAASKGSVHANVNSNNHPFVSSDKHIAVVHNGNIEESEHLKEKYELLTDTDSEVLLRIYESASQVDDDYERRLNAVADIFKVVHVGAMASAIGEADNAIRHLFLFRNEHRPLWLCDMRESLGQIIFFSSPDVWFKSLESLSTGTKDWIIKRQKLVEIPIDQIWYFKVDEDNPHLLSMNQHKRYELEFGKPQSWEPDGELVKVVQKNSNRKVITQLNENEEVKYRPKAPIRQQKPAPYTPSWSSQRNMYNFQGGGTEHEGTCKKIVSLIDNISTAITNACMEGNLTPADYQELLESLEGTYLELQGTMQIIGH